MSQIIAIFSLRGTQREVIFNYQYRHKRHLSPMTGIRKWQLDMISLCSLLQTREKRKPHIPINCLCFQRWKADMGMPVSGVAGVGVGCDKGFRFFSVLSIVSLCRPQFPGFQSLTILQRS